MPTAKTTVPETTQASLTPEGETVVARFEPDDGPLSPKVIRAIGLRVPQDGFEPTKTLFDES